MYPKEEASRIKQAFWTTLGRYLSPHRSAGGEKVNWINYKTGIKHLVFKMDADNRTVRIAIEFRHPDAGIRELLFEQFRELHRILESYLNEDWQWELHAEDELGKPVIRIGTSFGPVSVFKEDDWPSMISFLKPRLLALDEFWTDAHDTFQPFR